MSFLFRIDKRYSYHKRQPGPAGRRRFCAVQAFSPLAKTLAQGEFSSPEHLKSPEGGAGLWPAEPKQKDTLKSVSFCLAQKEGFEPSHGLTRLLP